MSRASEAALDALHAAVAAALAEGLSPGTDEDGKPIKVSPQLIAQAIKFLAVNGITAPASAPRNKAIAAALADLDLDDLEVGLN